MRPCISQATTLSAGFEDDVRAYADGGCPAVEVWLTKLEQHLEQHSPDDTRKLLSDRGITLAAAAYQGGLLLSQGEQRQAHFDHFRRRLDVCQFFGIPTLILAPDFAQRVDETSLGRAVASLGEAAQWAQGAGVRLALEFRGGDRLCATIPTALALASACGEPNVGVCLDVFHYYTGPSKLEDFGLLTRDNLFHVQVCDLLGVPRELATDAERILPGDGDLLLDLIVEQLRRIGYDGWVSLELMNPTLWQLKPVQVAEVGHAALCRLLGITPEFSPEGIA
jgi:sugar phosphate isomerase/epimerase